MRTVQVELPDELAEQAQRAGLLSAPRLETWLREQLRQQLVDELFTAMNQMAAAEPTPITPEEVAVEVHAMRAERRAANR